MSYLISFFVSVKVAVLQYSDLFGAAGGIRTSGLWSRSPTLYPAELRPHIYENRRWDEIHRIKL